MLVHIIGGPWAGQTREILHGQQFIAPVYQEPFGELTPWRPDHDMLTSRITQVTYHIHTWQTKNEEMHFATTSSSPTIEIMHELWKGYEANELSKSP